MTVRGTSGEHGGLGGRYYFPQTYHKDIIGGAVPVQQEGDDLPSTFSFAEAEDIEDCATNGSNMIIVVEGKFQLAEA